MRPPKIVYKVEEPDDDEYEQVPRRLEQVQLVNRAFLAKLVERENIIVDTGSNYNLIGRNLVKSCKKILKWQDRNYVPRTQGSFSSSVEDNPPEVTSS